jgi:hypothetical protein
MMSLRINAARTELKSAEDLTTMLRDLFGTERAASQPAQA